MNAQQHAVPMTKSQEQQAVQGAMQQAILKASTEAANKSAQTNVSPINAGKLKAVVVRRDLLGATLVFDVDSHVKNETGEFIDYFDGKSVKTAPIQYYHVAKPVSSDEAAKFVENYAKHMKVSQVQLRQRLIKNLVNRADDGSVQKEDLEQWKQKLIQALTKTIMEI